MKGLAVTVALLGLAHLGACQSGGRSENPCKRRGGTSPHESYCDKFYECVGNDEVVVRDCPNGLVYAGRTALVDVCGYEHEYPCEAGLSRSGAQQSSRRGESSAPREQLDPCKEESGIAAHKDYCDRYLECSAGQVYEVDCPNGLVFAERGAALLDNCGYPNQNPYACLNKQLANPPISTEHCDWLYGIFGHETSCTRYWTCWNGTSTEQFCIGGLLYNEKTHSCDWPEFVADCQKHPLCAEDANGNVPLGKSCERYWSCQGGYPRLMRCPATLVFDKVSRRCVHPPTEDCDVPPTESPEALGEEQPQQQQQGGGGGSRGRRPAPAPVSQPSQALDESPAYYDEEEFDPGFSQSAPAQSDPAPQNSFQQSRAPPPRPFRLGGSQQRPGPAPLRGPAIPAGAIPVN